MSSTVVAGNNRLPSRSEESGSHGQAFDPFTSKYGGKDGGIVHLSNPSFFLICLIYCMRNFLGNNNSTMYPLILILVK